MPKRVQRKRIRGWKMPKNTIYVGRPTKWGNPYIVCEERTAEEAVLMYKKAFDCDILDFTQQDIWLELAGKDLACWCPLNQPCHADVLLKLANLVQTGE